MFSIVLHAELQIYLNIKLVFWIFLKLSAKGQSGLMLSLIKKLKNNHYIQGNLPQCDIFSQICDFRHSLHIFQHKIFGRV